MSRCLVVITGTSSGVGEVGIAADHLAEMISFAYRMPRNVQVQDLCVTRTRQEH